MVENPIKKLLLDLNICTASSIHAFYPQVRDRSDVAVLKCYKSGVIFLSSVEHMDLAHYENKTGYDYWSVADRQQAVNAEQEDLQRRATLLKVMIVNRNWLDIGTGTGGLLDQLKPLAAKIVSVEPQKGARHCLQQLGYEVFPNIESINTTDFQIITLFHVFEHFTNPLDDLISIAERLSDNGKIIIEVPHANDFLISFLDLESFKRFTFWSEHLILHTRQSLEIFLKAAGFKEIIINAVQRYPLANHLYWLSKNKPGGHQHWPFLRSKELDLAYTQMLAKNNQTDTLVAIATKA